MKILIKSFFVYILLGLAAVGASNPPYSYEMAGEATEGSIILQTRLNNTASQKNWKARFELSESPGFEMPFTTDWQDAQPERDFIVKQRVLNLIPATQYYYRALWFSELETRGEAHSFKTLPGSSFNIETSFVVVNCMNYAYFQKGRDGVGITAYHGQDKHLGYPAFKTISKLNPDFFIQTGDGVYYDRPFYQPARTKDEMRLKWHEQFSQDRLVQFFSRTPVYWMIDDHDYRFDNAYPAVPGQPSHELGISVFVEQLPVVTWEDQKVLYRTRRINQTLQIWFLDGRTLRSPNVMPDGPEKSIWGKEQTDWLERTLIESDASFKIIVSSTPIIGPGRAGTDDNHTGPKGFQYEGRKFLEWLAEHGFDKHKIFFIAGDNHWKNHSEDPLGFNEFTPGALDDTNAKKGIVSGTKGSTDPESRIKQFYVDSKPVGGFLHVSVKPEVRNDPAKIEFSLYDSKGHKIYLFQD